MGWLLPSVNWKLEGAEQNPSQPSSLKISKGINSSIPTTRKSWYGTIACHPRWPALGPKCHQKGQVARCLLPGWGNFVYSDLSNQCWASPEPGRPTHPIAFQNSNHPGHLSQQISIHKYVLGFYYVLFQAPTMPGNQRNRILVYGPPQCAQVSRSLLSSLTSQIIWATWPISGIVFLFLFWFTFCSAQCSNTELENNDFSQMV